MTHGTVLACSVIRARYWAMICAGLDMITPVPIERWDNELYYDPDTSAPGKMPLGSMMGSMGTYGTAHGPVTSKPETAKYDVFWDLVRTRDPHSDTKTLVGHPKFETAKVHWGNKRSIFKHGAISDHPRYARFGGFIFGLEAGRCRWYAGQRRHLQEPFTEPSDLKYLQRNIFGSLKCGFPSTLILRSRLGSTRPSGSPGLWQQDVWHRRSRSSSHGSAPANPASCHRMSGFKPGTQLLNGLF